MITVTNKSIQLMLVKRMTADEQAISLANSVFQAMAYSQTIADIVLPKQQEIVDFYKFPVSKKVLKMYADCDRAGNSLNVITRAKDLYMAEDDDFQLYLKEMHAFLIEKGLRVPEFGFCPLLMAEDLERKVKRAFVDYLAQYTGMDSDFILCRNKGLENYKRFIELNLRLFASKVKSITPIN